MRFFVFIAALAAVLALATSAEAAKSSSGSCTVSPQQVSLGGSFTVSASGLVPSTLYLIEWDQAGPDPNTGRHNALQSDAGGNASGSFTTDSVVDGPLEAGWVKIKLRPVGQETSRPVICSFEILAA